MPFKTKREKVIPFFCFPQQFDLQDSGRTSVPTRVINVTKSETDRLVQADLTVQIAGKDVTFRVIIEKFNQSGKLLALVAYLFRWLAFFDMTMPWIWPQYYVRH